jgi:tRNA (guanine-N7-)-methyltransferase
VQRKILRSYGRTHGRAYGVRQRTMLEEHLSRYRLHLPEQGMLDIPSGRTRLEIGFGNGEHMVHQAGRFPDTLFLGAEPYLNGVANCIYALEQAGRQNVCVFPSDVHLLLDALPDSCLTQVDILFPDPWPKRAHHKRRLVNAVLLAKLARVMQTGAVLQMATDHADYAAHMLEQMALSHDFQWTARSCHDWQTPCEGWTPTRYQHKAIEEDRPAVFLHYERQFIFL